MVNAILSNPVRAEPITVDQAVSTTSVTPVQESTLPTPVVVQKPQANSAKDIEKAIATLNEHVQLNQRGIVFAVDKDTGIDVIKVVDSKTHKVILQFPSEDLIEVAKRLDDVRGVLFRKST